MKLLAQHGLKPQPADNDENLHDQFIERLRAKEEARAQGDEEIYYSAALGDYLEPTEIEALRLLNEKPKFRLSSASRN